MLEAAVPLARVLAAVAVLVRALAVSLAVEVLAHVRVAVDELGRALAVATESQLLLLLGIVRPHDRVVLATPTNHTDSSEGRERR